MKLRKTVKVEPSDYDVIKNALAEYFMSNEQNNLEDSYVIDLVLFELMLKKFNKNSCGGGMITFRLSEIKSLNLFIDNFNLPVLKF